MNDEFINLTLDNLEEEHICCAISDKKHQLGVEKKKEWLREEILKGHVFRKLDAKGKVFIEYKPLEDALVPIIGDNYIYIHCLWVSGSFKKKGYGKALLDYCIEDAKSKGKDGICVLAGSKKKPFLSDKKFLLKFGFKVVDKIDEYELLVLALNDKGNVPRFNDTISSCIDDKGLVIYYDYQCPYIPNSLIEVEEYCLVENIPFNSIEVDSVLKGKNLPCIFNNWGVFYKGKYKGVHLLNKGYLEKMIKEMSDD